MRTFKNVVLSGISLGIAGIASAQTPPPQNRQGPPPQALEACASKTIGEQCGFTGRRGEVTGQCAETPRGKITCRPEGRQQRPNANNRGQRANQRGQNGNGRPPGRSHSILQSSRDNLNLLPATEAPIANNKVSINAANHTRTIVANGIAAHKTGAFPNAHNPHSIEVQQHQYRVPLNPSFANTPTKVNAGQVGIAVNGVMIEPATAEVYKNAREWRYEALSGAVPLGIDANYAHVQPGGLYHYHGLPTGLMTSLGVNEKQHSPLIGYAADGFPIYALFGFKNAKDPSGGIQRESSSYRIGAQRPGGDLPGGTPDGTFAQDYKYVAGAGTLDECNGKVTVTPNYPQGTYAYFITDTFPVVPRCLKGTPSSDFSIR
ncbi:YHYH protein [Leucothrix sargassi]|nr:YHYH protein [Leucothrix sargassi]